MNNIIVVAIWLFMMSYSIFLFFSYRKFKRLTRKEIAIELDLHENGVNTQGHISRHSHPFILFVPALCYTYQHQEKSYQNKHYVIKRDFREKKDGTAVFVRYLPRDPGCATLVGIKSAAKNSQYYNFMATQMLCLAITCMISAIVIFLKVIIHFPH